MGPTKTSLKRPYSLSMPQLSERGVPPFSIRARSCILDLPLPERWYLFVRGSRDDLQQHVSARSKILRTRRFSFVMAQPSHARHEDHSRRNKLRCMQGIMPRSAHHATTAATKLAAGAANQVTK